MLDPLSVNVPLAERSSKLVLPKRKLLRQVEGTDDYIMEIDYSSISSFMECPRKSENYLIHGREAQREQVALNFGRLFHSLEETRMREGVTDESVKKQQHMIEDHFVYHPVPPDEYRTANRMHDVIKKYNDIHKT